MSQPTYEELRDAWETFDRGDKLTDQQLKMLKKNAEDGLKYLEARGERFVCFKTILDLDSIKGYINARKHG